MTNLEILKEAFELEYVKTKAGKLVVVKTLHVKDAERLLDVARIFGYTLIDMFPKREDSYYMLSKRQSDTYPVWKGEIVILRNAEILDLLDPKTWMTKCAIPESAKKFSTKVYFKHDKKFYLYKEQGEIKIDYVYNEQHELDPDIYYTLDPHKINSVISIFYPNSGNTLKLKI